MCLEIENENKIDCTQDSSPLVSIVVPIYKVEKWLRKCLDSIVGQTYRNLEIILIDDGSPDECPVICEEYAVQDNRIKVFHKENGGLVSARKFGYERTVGSYLFWVDSDDWIREDTIEKMVVKAEQDGSEIVWCDVQGILPNRTVVAKINFAENPKEMLHRLLEQKVPGWICNKLIRVDYYRKIQIHFAIGDDMFEDVYHTVQLLAGSPKMSYIPCALYCYNRTNETAFTAASQEAILKRGMPNIQHVYDFLNKIGEFETYKVSFSYQAMRLKIAYLLSEDISSARGIYPFAHKIIKAYPLSGIMRVIFYVIFNGGFLGSSIAKSYLTYKRQKITT